MASTIKMEVPVVQNTHRQLTNINNALRQQIQQARNQVKNTVPGAWQGDSATEFEARFEEWAQQATRLCDQMDQLLQVLNNEINQWIEMARTL